MKVKFLIIALLALCFSIQTAIAQTAKAEVDVQVFESVLSTASWAGFKYNDLLSQAKKGDYKATLKLLEFSGTVDGTAALDHSVTLLELILSGGDNTFAAAVNAAKPKLKSVLLERLQLAQGRTKKEALRKPISEWAPTTWEVLNGKPYAPKPLPGEEETLLSSKPYKAKEKSAAANQMELSSPVGAKKANPEVLGTEQPKGKQ